MKTVLEELTNDIFNFKNNNEDNKLLLFRYIYIKLGKILSYDEEFWYQRKDIDYLNREDKFIVLERLLEIKKVNCYTVAFIYRTLCEMFNLKADIFEEGDYGINHYYNIIYITDTFRLKVDLQLDLSRIHYNLETLKFECESSILKDIDKKINYNNKEYSYKKDIDMKDINVLLDYVITEFNQYDHKNSGCIERKDLFKILKYKYIDCKYFGKIYFATLYNINDSYFGVITTKNSIYVYDSKKYCYLKSNLEELNKLLSYSKILSGNIYN